LVNIKKGSPLIGVEGEMDCIYLQMHNVPAIRTGKFLSKEMIRIITGYTDNFVYSMDGDVPFVNSNPKKTKDSIKSQKKYLSKFMNVGLIELPGEKDPNDLSSKEVEKYYGKYINEKYFK